MRKTSASLLFPLAQTSPFTKKLSSRLGQNKPPSRLFEDPFLVRRPASKAVRRVAIEVSNARIHGAADDLYMFLRH
jgi:hypothetical protein